MENCSVTPPVSNDFFDNINMTEKIFIGFCGCVTFLTACLFLEKIMFVMRHYDTSKDIKYRSIQITGVYPVISLSAFVVLCIPRANLVCQLVTTVYISRAIFSFISMMIRYFDGKQNMLLHLKDSKIGLRNPPCCCCCVCLPMLEPTMKNVNMIKALVLQHVFLLPFLSFVILVLWIDGKYEPGKFELDNAYPYLTVLIAVSTILALYGFIVFFRMCRVQLKPFFIVPKFLTLQLVLVFSNFQEMVFSVLAKFEIPPCQGIVSSNVRGQAYFRMLLVLQMFILFLIARCFYRRAHVNPQTLIVVNPKAKQTYESCDCKTVNHSSDLDRKEKKLEKGILELKNEDGLDKMSEKSESFVDDVKDSDLLLDPNWLAQIYKCVRNKKFTGKENHIEIKSGTVLDLENLFAVRKESVASF